MEQEENVIQSDKQIETVSSPEHKESKTRISFAASFMARASEFLKKQSSFSRKTKFLKTSYTSGDMASIMLIQRKIKFWVKRAKKE